MTERDRSDVDAHNRAVYESDAVVREFTELRTLFPVEDHLFDRYARPGARVLDLGVGGGRTTAALRPMAARYVALDYSEAMVRSCREAHPEADVRLGDAADLREFDDGNFDLVVFSYNGIDYLHPVEKREQCLSEIARVLGRDGVLLLSTHNAVGLASPCALARRRMGRGVSCTPGAGLRDVATVGSRAPCARHVAR